jgi:fibronectin type 3 domain-containing protein
VRDTEVSPYSEIFTATSTSKFYAPAFAGIVQEDLSVNLTLKDRSYDDRLYSIYRTTEAGTDETFIAQIQMIDSGRLVTGSYLDYPDPGATYIYRVDAVVNDEGFPTLYNVASDTVYVPAATNEALTETPEFDLSIPPDDYICSKTIYLRFVNDNEGSKTEIYRSREADTGYIFIASTTSDIYYDTAVTPHTEYYYKLRAVKGDSTSAFSDPKKLKSFSDFYNPLLTASLLPDNTVQLSLEDRSYLDYNYEVYGVEAGTTDQTIYDDVLAADSGRTFIFHDTLVVPGKIYIYYVNSTVRCEGFPYYTNVAMDTIQIPEGPAVFGFTLVEPNTDTDVSALTNYYVIEAEEKYNIRANTNAMAGSVEFVLNAVHHTENEAPYALFGDDDAGNYFPGKMKPGNYILTATVYSENNLKGTKGNTITVHFTVESNVPSILGFTLVDPQTNQDAGPLQNGAIIDAQRQFNIRADANSKTGSVEFLIKDKRYVENFAPYALFGDNNAGDYYPGKLKPGSYTLRANAYGGNNGTGVKGHSLTISFTVQDNTAETIASESFSHTIDIYPNPVVNTAKIQISGQPDTSVHIELIDRFGKSFATYTEVLDSEGLLTKEVDAGTIPKGMYYYKVRINNKTVTKRMIIN